MSDGIKNISKIILSIITFAGLIFITQFLFMPIGQRLTTWKISTMDSNFSAKTVELPFLTHVKESGLWTFSTAVYPKDLQADVLHIPRINGYAFEVELNGHKIHQQGDFQNPTANIWNYSFLIDIPKGLLLEENIFIIRSFALHDVGFIMTPTLGQRSDFNLIIELQNFLSDSFSYIMIGASLFLGILLILVGRNGKTIKHAYIQFGLACIFFAVYNFEYTYRLYSGPLEVYLWLRKLLFASILLSIGFMIEGILSYMYHQKIPSQIKFCYSIGIIPVLFMNDYPALAAIIKVYNLIIIFITLYMIKLVIKSPKTQLRFSISFLSLTILHTVIVFIFRVPTLVFINYGMSFILIGLSYALVLDFDNLEIKNTQLNYKINIDPLTKAYNREYLDALHYTQDDVLIFIDIDYFKIYNDTLGHDKGDLLLKDLVQHTKKLIRSEDAIIRYGGDEFIIYLKQISLAQAQDKMIAIKAYVVSNFEYVDLSYGMSNFVTTLYETIKKADQDMYLMKKEKRRDNTSH